MTFSPRTRRTRALSLACVLIACVFIGLIYRFFFIDDELNDTKGAAGFRLFTILSNIFAGLVATMSVPYLIDRRMSAWMQRLLYCMGTTCAVTFLLSICIVTPTYGFYYAMFEESDLYLHTLAPLAGIGLFFTATDISSFRFKDACIAAIPAVSYAFVYTFMVFAVNYWPDFYTIRSYMPPMVFAIGSIPVVLGISEVLRRVQL